MRLGLCVPKLRVVATLVIAAVLVVATVPASAVAVQNLQYGAGGSKDAMDMVPVDMTLTGWGWKINAGCVSCMEYGNAVLELEGSATTRDNVTNVSDLYLTGEFRFNTADRTDNFTLELLGTRVSSAFLLRQVVGGTISLIAEIEGVWFDYQEPSYVACEGRLGQPSSDTVATLYVFILRNESAEGIAVTDSWLGRWTVIFDEVADYIVSAGERAQAAIGRGLAAIAEIAIWWAV